MPHVYFKYRDHLFDTFIDQISNFGITSSSKATSIKMDVDEDGFVIFDNIVQKANDQYPRVA